MDQVVATHGSREIHVVLDNLSTHSGSNVDEWLTRHPNVTFHFTPTGSSWLNQVEGRFSQWKHPPRRVRRIARRVSSSCGSYGVGR
jgi:transposase